MQLLFLFDQDKRIEKTRIQTLACQLSSTLMRLLFSFDQDMRVEKILIQTLACQLSSTLMQLLFSFDQDERVGKTVIQTLACQLPSIIIQLLSIRVILFVDEPAVPHNISVVDVKSDEVTITWKSPKCEMISNLMGCHVCAYFGKDGCVVSNLCTS